LDNFLPNICLERAGRQTDKNFTIHGRYIQSRTYDQMRIIIWSQFSVGFIYSFMRKCALGTNETVYGKTSEQIGWLEKYTGQIKETVHSFFSRPLTYFIDLLSKYFYKAKTSFHCFLSRLVCICAHEWCMPETVSRAETGGRNNLVGGAKGRLLPNAMSACAKS